MSCNTGEEAVVLLDELFEAIAPPAPTASERAEAATRTRFGVMFFIGLLAPGG